MGLVMYKCAHCGNEASAFDMDLDERDIPAYCPVCGKRNWMDKKQYSILVCEKIGVYEFKLNGDWLEYWTLYEDGFRFVRFNLVTGEENRDTLINWSPLDPVPSFLLNENGATLYNYFVG